MGGSLRFWRCSDCPFAHLELYESPQRLQLRAKEECVLQRDTVSSVTLYTEQRITTPIVHRHCGQDVLLDMMLAEVTVPMRPVGDGQAFIRKSQPLG